jgi:hypothetical protein
MLIGAMQSRENLSVSLSVELKSFHVQDSSEGQD